MLDWGPRPGKPDAEAQDVSLGTAAAPHGRARAVATCLPGAGSPTSSEDRYRWFVQSTAEGIWRLELDPPVSIERPADELAAVVLERSRVAEVNPAFARRCGFARPEEMLGSGLADLLAGSPDQQLEVVREFLRGGFRLDEFETRDRDRRGREFVVVNNVLGLVQDGLLLGAWGTSRDITRQRRAEEELRASELRFRSLIENVSDIVTVLDADANIRFESSSVERVMGYRPGDLVGSSALELVHPDDVARVAEAFALLVGSPGDTSPVVPIRARHRDGTWRSFEAVGRCRLDASGAPAVVVTFRDVTDRCRTEEALRESERRYRALFQNMLEGFAYCRVHLDEAGRTVDWTYLAVNDAFERLTGLKDVVGRRVSEIIPTLLDDSPELFEAYGRVASTGQPDEFDFDFHTLGIWLHVSVSSPEPGHFAAVFEDITDRRRAEESLRESEETLRVFINAIPEPALLLDLDETILAANQAMADAFGARAGDLIGTRALDLLPPDLAASRREKISEAIRSGQGVKWEDERGGRRLINHACPALDASGRARCVAIFAFDLTDLKIAEERLVTLAAAVEQAADDIVVTDDAGIITYVNSAFERTTGYARAEAVGRSPQFLEGGRHDEEFYRAIDATILSGRTWKGRFVNRTKDGRVILQDASISPIREGSGRIVGQVSARRDVTRQMEMEERAAQADKLEAIGTLAGGIAHDFNNILSAIVGYTEMALRKCPGGSPIQRDLQAVLQGSHRATELVKQILAFSRQTRQDVHPVQVGLIVKEAAKLLRAAIPATIEIRVGVRSSATVQADPTELHRIVVNLSTNAALAMHEQGGVLGIELEDEELGARFAAEHPEVQPGRFVRLTVRDTGCGMTREVMSRIFEPFFTTREPGRGTGMGLAVVHGIVARCGGAISVESEPGHGTAFHVFLPAIEQETPAEPAAGDGPAGGAERILVVDDEPMVAGMVVELLGELGYRAVCCHDGAEALATVAADPGAVDLVITDMTMPGMTGDVLAQRLKSLRPGLPVILCTGYSERMSAEAARAQGIDGFAMKPASIAELSQLVRAVLDRDGAQRATAPPSG